MAALGLLRLGRLAGESSWIELAESIVRGAFPLMERSPLASGKMLVVLQTMLEPSVELVFFSSDREAFEQLENRLRLQNLDSISLICRSSEDVFQSQIVDNFTRGKQMMDGLPTLFVCHNQACQKPAVGWDEIESAIGNLANQQLTFGGTSP